MASHASVTPPGEAPVTTRPTGVAGATVSSLGRTVSEPAWDVE